MDQQNTILIKTEDSSPLFGDLLYEENYGNIDTFSQVKLEVEAPEERILLFECSQCRCKYTKIDYLMIHELLHNSRLFCSICFKTFTSRRKFISHIKKHIKDKIEEENKEAFACDRCQKYFTSRKALMFHLIVHSNEKPHQCDICWKGCRSLRDHYTKPPERPFVCKLCNESFALPSALWQHKKQTHVEGKPLKCKHCDTQFLNIADYQMHRKQIHGEAVFTCPHCPMMFDSKYFLRKHQGIHSAEKPVEKNEKNTFSKGYQCLLCRRVDFNHARFLEHRNQHLRYRKADLEEARRKNRYKCKLCFEEYASEATLLAHMAVHIEKTIKCNLCQKFYLCSDLNLHKRNVHEVLRCRVCRKDIKGNANLKYHYRRYHFNTRKKFGCMVCRKQYFSKEKLARHVKLVHRKQLRKPLRRFRCRACKKIFRYNQNYELHVSLKACVRFLEKTRRQFGATDSLQIHTHLPFDSDKIVKVEDCTDFFVEECVIKMEIPDEVKAEPPDEGFDAFC